MWTTDEGEEFEVEVWDTAGQEALQQLRKLSYPGTDVFLFTYDTTSATSLENIQEIWTPEVEEVCSDYSGCVLVGTKWDWYEEKDADGDTDDLVDIEDVKAVSGDSESVLGVKWMQVAEEIGASYVFTSAKTGYGVVGDEHRTDEGVLLKELVMKLRVSTHDSY